MLTCIRCENVYVYYATPVIFPIPHDRGGEIKIIAIVIVIVMVIVALILE